jgi:hypothetical protein
LQDLADRRDGQGISAVICLGLQPDGQAIILGQYGGAGLRLCRVDEEGLPDGAFNASPVNPSINASFPTVQADGKILVAGTSLDRLAEFNRLNADGTPGSLFSADTNPTPSQLRYVALGNHGSVLVAGQVGTQTLVRLNPGGSVDGRQGPHLRAHRPDLFPPKAQGRFGGGASRYLVQPAGPLGRREGLVQHQFHRPQEDRPEPYITGTASPTNRPC